jgi:hypothetical protein
MRGGQIFLQGDRILVHGNVSRHQGRVATITTVGDRRLTVRFADNQPGSFVDYKVALLLPPRGVTTYTSNEYDVAQYNPEGNVTPPECNRILNHLLRALAAAIAQEHEDEMAMEEHIDNFAFDLRCAVTTAVEDCLEREVEQELERERIARGEGQV